MLSCRPVNPHDSVRSIDLVRVEGAVARPDRDRVAVERALEVRLDGEPFSVIMRTPGEDRALAIGFLFSEGVLRAASDLAAATEEGDDVVNVTLAPGRATALGDILGSRRNV